MMRARKMPSPVPMSVLFYIFRKQPNSQARLMLLSMLWFAFRRALSKSGKAVAILPELHNSLQKLKNKENNQQHAQ